MKIKTGVRNYNDKKKAKTKALARVISGKWKWRCFMHKLNMLKFRLSYSKFSFSFHTKFEIINIRILIKKNQNRIISVPCMYYTTIYFKCTINDLSQTYIIKFDSRLCLSLVSYILTNVFCTLSHKFYHDFFGLITYFAYITIWIK